MQRQFYILSTALLLLFACSREEGAEPGQSGETAVRFTAMADVQTTKATTTSLLSNNAKVTVYAWMKSDLSTSAPTPPAHSNNYTVSNKDGKGSLAPVGSAMKVQTGVVYFFYALSTNSDKEAVPALNGDYTTESLVNGVDYLMAVAKNSNNGYTFQTTNNSDVPLTFSHLATRVVLTVQPADPDGYTSADALSVGIASIDGAGSYIDLSASAIHWVASDAGPVTGGIPLDRLEGGQRDDAQKESGQQKFTVSFILLPVSSPAQGIPVQLDFTGLKFEDAATGAAKSYTAQLKGSGGNSLVLEGGKTYNFDVRISRYSASFSAPEVISWEEVETDVDNMQEEAAP